MSELAFDFGLDEKGKQRTARALVDRSGGATAITLESWSQNNNRGYNQAFDLILQRAAAHNLLLSKVLLASKPRQSLSERDREVRVVPFQYPIHLGEQSDLKEVRLAIARSAANMFSHRKPSSPGNRNKTVSLHFGGKLAVQAAFAADLRQAAETNLEQQVEVGSRLAGPVPSLGARNSSYAERPAITYCMEMIGSAVPHLVRGHKGKSEQRRIFKIGWALDPAERISELNALYPDTDCSRWEIWKVQRHPTQSDAYRVEQSILKFLGSKELLTRNEIAFCTRSEIAQAWRIAIEALRIHPPQQEGVLLKPGPIFPDASIDAVAGSLKRPGRALTLKEMDDAVAREAKRRARD